MKSDNLITEIPNSNISSLLILNQSLNNDEIYEQVYKRLFLYISSNNSSEPQPKSKNTEQIVDKIKIIHKIETFLELIENQHITGSNKTNNNFIHYVNSYLEKEYNEIVDEIALHFNEIEEQYFYDMNEVLLNSVLSSSKLILKSEDSLLSVLLNRRTYILSNRINKNNFFIEKVEFEYLSEKSIEFFLNEIQLNDIDDAMWSQIKKRLILPVQVTKKLNRKYQFTQFEPTFKYDSEKPFNGIFHYLTEKSNGNIQTNKTIEITSTEKCCGKYETLVDFNDSDGYTHLNGSNTPIRWLQIDFKTRKVHLDSYLIRSFNKNYRPPRALKSWKVEISLDSEKWIEIDNRENVPDLNGDLKMQVFKVKVEHSPFRFLRIITDKDNWADKDGFTIGKLELFGNIIE